jgi:hypothetical protein
MSVVGWNGKPSALWTLCMMALSSFSASAIMIGCKDSKARHFEMMFWLTILRRSVIRSCPIILGNWKALINAFSSSKRAVGLSTLV